MDEKTKAQIQQEAADLVAKLQPRSGKFRTISPEMDPLRLGVWLVHRGSGQAAGHYRVDVRRLAPGFCRPV